jgi:hypothetical protein
MKKHLSAMAILSFIACAHAEDEDQTADVSIVAEKTSQSKLVKTDAEKEIKRKTALVSSVLEPVEDVARNKTLQDEVKELKKYKN